tara:strand:- start:97 stop:339 length:243 start_codon:yes stop_codon:yes gene_type:complete
MLYQQELSVHPALLIFTCSYQGGQKSQFLKPPCKIIEFICILLKIVRIMNGVSLFSINHLVLISAKLTSLKINQLIIPKN